MKKIYKKPEISFESFELSSAIASGCGTSQAVLSQGNCPVMLGNIAVFMTGISGCVYTTQDGNFNLCYYVPNADNSLFGS